MPRGSCPSTKPDGLSFLARHRRSLMNFPNEPVKSMSACQAVETTDVIGNSLFMIVTFDFRGATSHVGGSSYLGAITCLNVLAALDPLHTIGLDALNTLTGLYALNTFAGLKVFSALVYLCARNIFCALNSLQGLATLDALTVKATLNPLNVFHCLALPSARSDITKLLLKR